MTDLDPTELPEAAAEIVETVYDYRFITAPQLARIFSVLDATLVPALQRLVDGAFLAGVRRPVFSEKAPDTVYTLAQRGANALASRWGVDRAQLYWRKYHNYVGLLFVEHRLAVNDVRIALAADKSPSRYLAGWTYEPPIREASVDDPDELAPPLSLRPDAYGVLVDRRRRIHFFLEVDMSTESHARFASKIRRYLAYRESQLFRYQFSGRSFRVLTVAQSVTRSRALRLVAEAQGAQKVFWFAAMPHVTRRGVGEAVWDLPGETDGAALFRDLS